MLLLVPGKDETVRVNGAAWVTTDAVGARPVGRRTAATDHRHRRARRRGVRPLREGVPAGQGLEPDSWTEAADVPEALDVLAAQGVIGPVNDAIRAGMETDYADGLA